MNKPEFLRQFESSRSDTAAPPDPNWIALVRLALDVHGQAAAQALWHMSPLPKPPSLPVIEAMFARDCLDGHQGGRVQASELHRLYAAWCAGQGYEPLDPRGFGRAMTRLGFTRHKASTLYYKNVRVRRTGGDHDL